MLRLLRNLVLAAILLAGAVKLLAWYAVGNDAERMIQALAPYAQIKYDSLSTGLDGSVTVTRPSVTQGAEHRVYRADSVTFETPGLFWLLEAFAAARKRVPTALRVSAKHLQIRRSRGSIRNCSMRRRSCHSPPPDAARRRW